MEGGKGREEGKEGRGIEEEKGGRQRKRKERKS